MLARPPASLVAAFASVLVCLGVSAAAVSFGVTAPPVPRIEDVRAAPSTPDRAEPVQPETCEQARRGKRARLKATVCGTHACAGLGD